MFAEAIAEKAGIPDARAMGIMGYIDGTIKRICKPTLFQAVCYSGHKKLHGMKYQIVTGADGIMYNVYGPVEGRRHDITLLHKSNLLALLASPIFVNVADPDGMDLSVVR